MGHGVLVLPRVPQRPVDVRDAVAAGEVGEHLGALRIMGGQACNGGERQLRLEQADPARVEDEAGVPAAPALSKRPGSCSASSTRNASASATLSGSSWRASASA